MSLEAMIDALVSDAQLATGADRDVLQAQVGFARAAASREGGRPARWTAAEDEFLRANLTRLGVEECGRILGRSANAIKIRFTRTGIKAPTRAAGWLTANQAARLLGVDSHKTAGWIDAGIMPGGVAEWSVRKIRMLTITQLKMWLIRPETWVYVDAAKIQQPSLRRLVRLAQERWGDEWWSMRQVADYHGVDLKTISQLAQRGKLAVVRAVNLGGRDAGSWAFLFARRSDAIRLEVRTGRGRGISAERQWPAAADAFMLRARAKGIFYRDIARMMKWSEKRVVYRVGLLMRGKRRASYDQYAD